MNRQPDLPEGETHLAPAAGPSAVERLAPGAIVAERFRIVALLGRGGMGEVYRADDTKLGHAVALKFLTAGERISASRLDRLRAEVRLGRQVSHPNVCRIYDLGESHEGPFIAMEYVDGEDLASLLRRIGRLPPDKALEIGRDLSAGLAAAHDVGILHRDLKPANVMIDGRGRARITDFGLAAVATELEGGGGFAGTPAYMAPEQLEGGPVTPRSDIYALGLVLYEVFTGKRLFDGRTIDEIRSQHRSARPPNLSTSARDINPAIERVIARCVEENPADRPSSAHAVIAALPGGDPLAAALAAGETPSPGLVAAAGQTGELRPLIAWALTLAALAAVLLVAVMASKTTLVGLVPLPNSSDVLDARGRQILERLGYDDLPASTAHEWILDHDYAAYMTAHNPSPDRWQTAARMRPGVFLFAYRTSTRPMVAWNWQRRIVDDDPPLLDPGMTRVTVDPSGRLTALVAVPAQKENVPAAPAAIDWTVPFSEAGVDPARFHPVPSVWTAPIDVDEKKAWDGILAEQPDVPLHIETGAHRGRVVWFRIFGPWTVPVSLRATAPPTLVRIGSDLGAAINGLVLIPAMILAVRNVRRGRGDRRGAFRLAVAMALTSGLGLLFRADHPSGPAEMDLIDTILSRSLWNGAVLWLFYVALEPYVRRNMPQTLIAWSRLLAGRYRDAMVGRDALIGVLGGAIPLSVLQLERILAGWLGWPPPAPMQPWTSPLDSARHVAFFLLDDPRLYARDVLVFIFLIVVLRGFFRRPWLAAALVYVTLTVGFASDTAAVGASPALALAVAGLMVGVVLYVLLRWGVLASIVMGTVNGWLVAAPLTLDASSWYAGRSFLVLGACAAIAIYGLVVSLGRQPIFGTPLFDE